MRRQRRHFGIGLHFENDGAVGGQGFFPGGAELIWPVDEDAAEPDKLGEFVIAQIRNGL